MSNDFDQDRELKLAFARTPEPEADRDFTVNVMRRVNIRRRSRLIGRITLACLVLALAAALSPWLAGLTAHLALGYGVLAKFALVLAITPVGWAIGGAMGLVVILRARS